MIQFGSSGQQQVAPPGPLASLRGLGFIREHGRLQEREYSSYPGKEGYLFLEDLLNGVKACPGKGGGEEIERAEETSG